MAEEKIRVLVSKNPCEKCDIKPCTRKCMFRTLFEKAHGMTRQEAIEKGAKAICRQRASCAKGCTKCSACELWRNFVTHAEAVINDLLGVK